MSFLRRRPVRESPDDSSRESTPGPGTDDTRVVPIKRLRVLERKLTETRLARKGTKRRHFWVFVLGGLFGLAVAAFFAGHNDMIDIPGFADLNLDSFLDVLPAGFLKDAQDIQVRVALLISIVGILSNASVETRKGDHQLRFFLRRPSRKVTRHRSQAPCHHDTWGHFYRA